MVTTQRPLQLHYEGDVRNAEFGILGPNIFGERFVVRELHYDAELDVTTALLRFATTADLIDQAKRWANR